MHDEKLVMRLQFFLILFLSGFETKFVKEAYMYHGKIMYNIKEIPDDHSSEAENGDRIMLETAKRQGIECAEGCPAQCQPFCIPDCCVGKMGIIQNVVNEQPRELEGGKKNLLQCADGCNPICALRGCEPECCLRTGVPVPTSSMPSINIPKMNGLSPGQIAASGCKSACGSFWTQTYHSTQPLVCPDACIQSGCCQAPQAYRYLIETCSPACAPSFLTECCFNNKKRTNIRSETKKVSTKPCPAFCAPFYSMECCEKALALPPL